MGGDRPRDQEQHAIDAATPDLAVEEDGQHQADQEVQLTLVTVQKMVCAVIWNSL